MRIWVDGGGGKGFLEADKESEEKGWLGSENREEDTSGAEEAAEKGMLGAENLARDIPQGLKRLRKN